MKQDKIIQRNNNNPLNLKEQLEIIKKREDDMERKLKLENKNEIN